MKSAQLRTILARNHKFLNDHEPFTLLHHRGNMDFQFICNAYGAATYCCIYSSKAEAPDQNMLSKKILRMIAKENDLGVNDLTRKKLFLCAQAIYSSREVSMQEICWYLLNYKFVWKTRDIIDVNLSSKKDAPRILKNSKELAKLQPGSTDIFAPVRIFPKTFDHWRSLDFATQTCSLVLNSREWYNDLSYYSFLTWFSPFTGNKDTIENKLNRQRKYYLNLEHENEIIFYVKRKKAIIVNLKPYIPIDEEEQESARSLLLLHHKHFKSIPDIYRDDRFFNTNKSFEEQSVEILKRKLENGSIDLCSSYEVCTRKAKKFQKTLIETRLESNAFREKDEDDDSVDYELAENDLLYSEAENYDYKDLDNFSGSIPLSNGVYRVSNNNFTEALNFIKNLIANAQKERQLELAQFQRNSESNEVISDIPATLLSNFQTKFQRLGSAQKEAFCVVSAHVLKDACTVTETNPTGQLRFHLGGAAGTGKSALIEAIVLYCRLHYGHDGSVYGPILVLAPTGIASFNIKGKLINEL